MSHPIDKDSWTELRRKSDALAAANIGEHLKESLKQDIDALMSEIQLYQIEVEKKNSELAESRFWPISKWNGTAGVAFRFRSSCNICPKPIRPDMNTGR